MGVKRSEPRLRFLLFLARRRPPIHPERFCYLTVSGTLEDEEAISRRLIKGGGLVSEGALWGDGGAAADDDDEQRQAERLALLRPQRSFWMFG